MMVAVAMFRASGAIDLLGILLKPILEFLGMPVDLLPLALTRSLSGSGQGVFLLKSPQITVLIRR